MRNGKAMRKTPLLLFLAVTLLMGMTAAANASNAPYTSLTVDKDGHRVRTVDGYLPSVVWDQFGGERLQKPSDLFIFRDEIYIADTGNRRIVVCDLNGDYLWEIESDELKMPSGVFVTEDGLVYVADPAAKMIFAFDRDGNIVKSFGTPVSPLFGKNARYAPNKVIVNSVGTVYALSTGNADGILTISDHGDFYGYFGANATNLSLANRIRRIFFTEEQLQSLQQSVPVAAINLDMDQTGLIYTVTQGTSADGLKKYNMAGSNMFGNLFVEDLVTDVAVGNIENIFTVSSTGYICEYTRDGDLLFYFGGQDDGNNRSGLYVNAVAIDVDAADQLYVLDGNRGNITVLQPTEYANTVHEALALYQEGFYDESKGPWEQVLQSNSLFDFAWEGIGEGYYKLGDYENAMDAARLGGAKGTYSSAFWQLRNHWLRENIMTVFWVVLAFCILRKVWITWGDDIPGIRQVNAGIRKLRGSRPVKEISHLGYMIRNPADAIYGIKFERKVSVLTASFMYVLVFAIFVINKYFSGFLFKTTSDGEFDIVMDLVLMPGIMLLFVVCSHMICDIRDGEGSLKQTFCGFVYCFAPYIFLKPLVFVLSHVLTFNEAFLITLLNFIMTAGTGILIFLMIREINCYTYRETFISILLTIFTMVVLVAAGVILFALLKQVADFLVSIYKEVYFRGS